MPTRPLPERLTPLAAAAGLRAFYGDIHNHCGLSYGHGSLEQALVNARGQLDFVSVTGHASWPDMPVDDPRVAHIVDFHVEGFARLRKLWPDHFDTLARFHEPGAFTVFPGYEIHSFAHGDYTIVLRDLDQRTIVEADTPQALLTGLRRAYGERAFAFPHHIGYRQGARGINWQSLSAALSPVVEMISMHGCAEASLTDRPFLHSMGPCDGHGTVHWGLGRGHVFGVIGNTDHHSGYPGSYGHGRTVVHAPENTAETIWTAIHRRHTGALTGDNAHLFARLGAAQPGDVVEPGGEGELAIEAVGGSFIDQIDVIRNGALERRITPALEPAPLDRSKGRLETLVVLELGWGSRGSHHDWQGRIALKGGRILAVEPRLRGPEIVSPLEGGPDSVHEDRIDRQDDAISFRLRARANPNNATPAMQGLCARVLLEPEARLRLTLDGQEVTVPAARLLEGAVSGNVGPIDSPAWRLHPLPLESQWQWRGRVPVGALRRGDWLMLRMRQLNGQWAWSSPFFCR